MTNGAQQGLDLVFRTFTDPGDPVAVESPTYSGALALARFADVDIVEMPMESDGPDISRLLGRRRVKAVYVMPERQNPTGITTSEARRHKIVQAASGAGSLIVEDGFEEPESGLPPLAALAQKIAGEDDARWEKLLRDFWRDFTAADRKGALPGRLAGEAGRVGHAPHCTQAVARL